MAEAKTKPTKESVSALIKKVSDKSRREDCFKVGKHKTGKSCLYIKKLADVDLGVLKKIVEKSVKGMASRHVEK
jgi:hypothetical protein